MGTSPRRVIANLPYNIATTLLIKWLEHASEFASLTLMFQREVALRITARPGDSEYGRLSVLANWKADTEILFDVPASAFVPPPKIISSVIQIVPLAKPRFACKQTDLEDVTRHAFGQRRKMLRASLKRIGGQELLEEVNINPEARPQELEIAEFCALARCLEARDHQKQP
jgi:16S rRNA (adenine1518-N6/adenine1519-N6)-dimethyltransferase